MLFNVEYSTGLEREMALETACREVNRNTYEGAFARTSPNIVKQGISNLVNVTMPVVSLPARISSLFHNSQNEKDFLAEVDEIKDILNPNQRIKRVYELVFRYQGDYDYGRMNGESRDLVVDPSQLISGQRGGVCRDFAFLMEWTLDRVQFPSREALRAKKHNNILEYSFQSKIIGSLRDFVANGKKQSYGHAWIRVLTYVRESDGRLNQRYIDLDTTWYTDVFVPLPSRNMKIRDDKAFEIAGVCEQVLRCLQEGESLAN